MQAYGPQTVRENCREIFISIHYKIQLRYCESLIWETYQSDLFG